MRPQGKAVAGGPEIQHRAEESGVRSGAAGSLHTHWEVLAVSVDSLLHPTDPGSLWGSVLLPSLFLSPSVISSTLLAMKAMFIGAPPTSLLLHHS